MERLFITLANMSITAGLLVLVVTVTRLVFRKLPKWIFCILWGLVAVRLLVPYSFESRLSLIPSIAVLPTDITDTAHPRIHSGITAIDEIINRRLSPSLYNGAASEADAAAETSNPGIPESETKAVESKDHFTEDSYGSLEGKPYESINPTQILSFLLSRLWLAGMLGLLIYALISYLLLRRKVMTAVRLEGNIYESEFAGSPFLLGIIRPGIYLPYGIGEEERKYVIAHERAHIARLDHIWKPLGFVLLSVYWFNPLMWVAYIFLCRDIESACDEKVISEMMPGERQAYSNTLLNISAGLKRRYITACPLAFGEVGVKNRIKNVMNYKKPVFWIVAAAIVGCIVLAVCFLTDPVKDKANGADLQTVNGTEAGSQTGNGNETGSQTGNGNETGSQVTGNGNGENPESIPTLFEFIDNGETVGLPRSESIFADNMYDAIREDWEKWEAMDEVSRMASSHMAGCGFRYFETWKEAVEFIGVEPWNPLEDADWLEKMNYTGADVRNLFDENMLPHCSVEWIGSKDGKLTFAEITTGYATYGGIRVTVRIELYNAASQGDDQMPDGESSTVTFTNTYHERATAKQANFRHKNADGIVFDYTLRVVSLETGQGALKKPTEIMNRVLKYMGLDEIPATKEDYENGESIPGTDTDDETDFYVNTGENATTENIDIQYIDKPDISDGLQIVVWQMAANSYSCILLPRNEEIYMNYLIGGTGYEAHKKKIIASGNPDAILEEINKLENMPDTAAADQK